MKLAFRRVKDWRSRWCYFEDGVTIHRVKSVHNRRAWAEFPQGAGETVCGKQGAVSMPGFGGRMHARRCAKCCDALALPRGRGAPYNDPRLFPPEGAPLRRRSPLKGPDR